MHELFAVTDQRGRESLEHLEALLEEVGGRASGVSERLEDLSRHHEEVIGRATAWAAEQISLGESAVAERARGAETEIGQRIADLIAIAERDAEELRHRARARVDEEYARLEQETQEELGRVIGRMRAPTWRTPTPRPRSGRRAVQPSRSWSTVWSSGRASPVSGWRRRRSRRSASCASRWSGCGPRWRGSMPRLRSCGRVG